MADKDETDASTRAANEADLHAWRNYLDLPVPMTVELGRARLTARELLELDERSVITLSRSTGEGVDLFAGSFCIARGEVVMIEDRTGVRINEIVVPEKR